MSGASCVDGWVRRGLIRARLANVRDRRTVGAPFVVAAIVMAAAWPSDAGASGCGNQAFRTGRSAALPDCRVFEQVTPGNKSGFDAPTVSVEQFPAQASTLGGSVVFMSIGAFAESQSSGLPNAYVASRGSGGWQAAAITPPTPQTTPTSITEFGYGYDFSEDLSDVVVKVPFQSLAPAGEEATPGVYNLFLSRSRGGYALVTAAAPSTTPGTCVRCFDEEDMSGFMGANAGGGGVAPFSHVLFEANENLVTSPTVGSEQFVENLYESDMSKPAGERVHPVGILPDGSIAATGSVAGAGLGDEYSTFNRRQSGQAVARAISADGSRVLFEAAADGSPDPAQTGEYRELYDRLEGSSTIEVSVPAPGATPANSAPEPATFWTASTDGSHVFFTSSAELTTASNTGPANEGNDLYSYDVASGELADLTVDPTGVGAGVLGVVGASEDGSYVYFVASGQLQEGQGTVGLPNLYVSHGGEVRFVATLNPSDASAWTPTASEAQAYVTPDGSHLAFMSINSLTGYDNQDLNVPSRNDSEVYEYSAEAHSLACASCDSTGARPIAGASIEVISTPFHHPRVLNDEGTRLFFESGQPLEGSSTGGLFEYEGGHAHMIASGQFLDASATGEDVFFASREQLAAGDADEFVDVYDARVGGEPNLPPSAVECAAGCQGAPPAAPSFATPDSATFFGPGNLTPLIPPKTAAQVRAEKLAKAIRACRSKAKAKRRSCEAQARRRYGAKPKAKKSSRRTKR
jgi:hypothetical protein